jgi:hypothetical protein
LDDPFLTSIVQHLEHVENRKFIGRHSTTRPTDAVAAAAILIQHYCLVPCTIHPGGQLGPLTSSLLWPRKRHPTANFPPYPLIHLPANAAASLASRSFLNLVVLPKADQGWREAHDDHFWFTRDGFATLPSHWVQQVLDHNLLVGLTSQLDIGLSRAHPYL